MSKIMYFIVDPTHTDFATMLAEAETAQAEYVDSASTLSWRYNNDNTKVMAKVIGGTDTWYVDSPWFNNAAILASYTEAEHGAFKTEMQKTEWYIEDTLPDGEA